MPFLDKNGVLNQCGKNRLEKEGMDQRYEKNEIFSLVNRYYRISKRKCDNIPIAEKREIARSIRRNVVVLKRRLTESKNSTETVRRSFCILYDF